MLIVVFVATMLSACALGDFGENDVTDAKLYATYKSVVTDKGYVLVSQEEFTKLLDTMRSEGLTISSLNAPKLTDMPNDNTKQQWVLEFVMSDGSTKTAVLPATKIDDGNNPNPTPNPNPNPNPQPVNDGKTIDTAYTVAEASKVCAALAENAVSTNQVYVKGYITTDPEGYTHSNKTTYNFYIDDTKDGSTTAFMVYSADAGNHTVKKGSLVVIYGYLKHFVKNGSSTYEIAYDNTLKVNPTVVKVDGNSDTPTIDPDKGTSADKAYTVAEVLTAFANLGSNRFSDNPVYLKGKIIWEIALWEGDENYEPFYYMYLGELDADNEDENNKVNLYVDYFDISNYPNLAVGDTVVLYGYIMHYDDQESYLTMTYYTVDEQAGEYINPVIVSASSGGSTEPDPSGHNFPSYFTYDKCTDESCNVIGRKTADGTFANKFKYILTQSDVDGYLAAYDWLAENVSKSGVNVNTFYNKFDTLARGLDNVYCQNQIAEVLSYVSGNYDDYDTSNEYYNNLNDKYMSLIATILNGSNNSLKTELNQHTQEWERELAQSTSGAEGIADINNEINKIMSEYNTAQKQGADTATFEALYQRLVTQNNLLAEKYNYGANGFMTYSYKNDYGRDYTPEQTKAMSALVLKYIKPLYETISQKLDTKSTALQNNGTDADWSLVEGLLSDNLFAKQSSSNFGNVKAAIQSIADYFKYLDSNNSGATFCNAVENLSKTGNYFTGSTEGAFTYYIYEVEKPILYFCTKNCASIGESANYYYASGFTFVHEFGHYYESIKNNANISMDFCETQSQGNEMLFTAWLANNNNATIGYEALKYNQLANILETILSATAVDEFEQAAYSGKYNGKDVNANNYQNIYNEICEKYGISGSNESYWIDVCFDSAAYYISYAMSALPSIEIYAKAVAATDGGLDVAKNAYLTLFKTDSTDYNVMLEKAGLHNAFEEELYKYLTANIK